MPLPKAPTKLADILEDYGPAAKPSAEAPAAPAAAAPAAPASPLKPKRVRRTAAPAEAALEKTPETAARRAEAPKAAPKTRPAKAPARRSAAEPAPAAPQAEVPQAPQAADAPFERFPKKKRPAQRAALFSTPILRDEKESPAPNEAQPAAAPAPASQAEAAHPAVKPAKSKKPAAAKKPQKAPAVKAEKTSRTAQASKAAPNAAALPAAGSAPAAKPQKNAPAAKPMPPASLRRGRAQTPENLPKMFVLDTNVLMHDPLSLFRFAEHDVFLPMTTLEELDNHKKGLTDVARNARSASRTLDALIEANGGQLKDGVPLSLLGNSEASGRLWFETKPLSEPLPEALPSFKGDNSILATVRGVQHEFKDRAVVLVSKDINMRIKATTLGIPAEDYFSDKVLDDTDMLYTGRLELPEGFWDQVGGTLSTYQDKGATHYQFEVDDPSRFILNECITVAGDEGFMGIVKDVSGRRITVRLLRDYRTGGRHKVWGISARNREQNMALNLLMDPEIDFVTLLGQAGTGKTLMTLAAALTQAIDERRFSEIIMTRATVSVGEDIGFLPGTEEEKMAPWMGALEDNLEVLHRSDAGGDWGRQATLDIIRNRIRVKSMSFMRGRTFLEKFVIIDEAQNLSPKQMKTLITRAGPGTKIVCLGNIAQIDTPYLTEGSSGLTYVVERFQGWAHAATITLTRGERSRLADYATQVL